MIQFLVTAVFVVICLFALALILCLMIWVVTRLLRFLFPDRFYAGSASAPKNTKDKKKAKKTSSEKVEDRCKSCDTFGTCPAAFSHVIYPCKFYSEKKADAE